MAGRLEAWCRTLHQHRPPKEPSECHHSWAAAQKKQISHIGRSYLKLLQQTKSLFHLLITAIANHAVFFKSALRFLFELQINQQ